MPWNFSHLFYPKNLTILASRLGLWYTLNSYFNTVQGKGPVLQLYIQVSQNLLLKGLANGLSSSVGNCLITYTSFYFCGYLQFIPPVYMLVLHQHNTALITIVLK